MISKKFEVNIRAGDKCLNGFNLFYGAAFKLLINLSRNKVFDII